ncbi:MAG: hypothetical protein FJ102_18390 [Deltaproteobacteria bacterium]|nr:hypothetical protein [Deltaproteobacteria bacterium]
MTGPDDRRTTPDALRWPALGLLVLTFAYFGACYRYALSPDMPAWSYPAQWSMFTEKETWHHDVGAQMSVDGVVSTVDLEALFPSRWDSGPRYVRGPFRNNPRRMTTLAQAICRRAEPKPDRVVAGDVRWRARIGVPASDRPVVEQRVLVDFDCDEEYPLPAGRRL